MDFVPLHHVQIWVLEGGQPGVLWIMHCPSLQASLQPLCPQGQPHSSAKREFSRALAMKLTISSLHKPLLVWPLQSEIDSWCLSQAYTKHRRTLGRQCYSCTSATENLSMTQKLALPKHQDKSAGPLQMRSLLRPSYLGILEAPLPSSNTLFPTITWLENHLQPQLLHVFSIHTSWLHHPSTTALHVHDHDHTQCGDRPGTSFIFPLWSLAWRTWHRTIPWWLPFDWM